MKPNRIFAHPKTRSAARKGHRVGVVIVAVIAIVIAFAGTAHFVVQAWQWSTASVLHATIAFGGFAACLLASRTRWPARS